MTDQPRPPIPAVAQVAEVIGGPEDGQKVALIDTRDTLLALVVDHDGNLDVRTTLGPVEVANVLRQIAKAASLRALEHQRAQS